ncbi:MAG: hypothetical protein KZQ72_15175 [Candidatus Thiodiazotropha sp. (ex Cardiolucina cf. quadrata)]|nr:hypothetical protein [Candidatus Thiodiazotropha sp. (ex Cardiolucina cf. quadrata)]
MNDIQSNSPGYIKTKVLENRIEHLLKISLYIFKRLIRYSMKQFSLIYSLFFLFSTTTYANSILTKKGTEQLGTPHIVMMGASYLKGWTLDKIDCLAVVNMGVSGETSTQFRERFEVDALTAKPKAVIIWGHINDFSNAPKDKERQTRKTAIENLKTCLIPLNSKALFLLSQLRLHWASRQISNPKLCISLEK